MVVKGGVALEQLAKTGVMVFDKTGTLTRGEFSVLDVMGESPSELLRVAALCETYSNHPVAQAIRAACPAPAGTVSDIRELPGHGITALVDGKRAAAGNRALMDSLHIAVPARDAVGTVIHVALEDAYLGAVTVGDTLREDAPGTIEALHAAGVRRTVMLTGDNHETAKACAHACGIHEYHAQLLPQDKVAAVEKLLGHRKKKETVAFVGDGVNDAPVLTMADTGIAMGGVGSDAAVEAADVVILNDDISKLPRLLRLARHTCFIAKENIIFALLVKGVCLVLGALGLAGMWLAVFADVGVSVLAILNSLRVLRSKG